MARTQLPPVAEGNFGAAFRSPHGCGLGLNMTKNGRRSPYRLGKPVSHENTKPAARHVSAFRVAVADQFRMLRLEPNVEAILRRRAHAHPVGRHIDAVLLVRRRIGDTGAHICARLDNSDSRPGTRAAQEMQRKNSARVAAADDRDVETFTQESAPS